MNPVRDNTTMNKIYFYVTAVDEAHQSCAQLTETHSVSYL